MTVKSSAFLVAIGILVLIAIASCRSREPHKSDTGLDGLLSPSDSNAIQSGSQIGMAQGDMYATARLAMSPPPMINEESVIVFSVTSKNAFPDAQVVLQIPEFWTVSSSQPVLDDDVVGEPTWESPEHPYDSRYITWETSFDADETAAFVVSVTPTEGNEDSWHSRITLHLEEEGSELGAGAIAIYYARVGDNEREGTFTDEYPDMDLDLQHMMSDRNDDADEDEDPIVVYTDGTSEPMSTALSSLADPDLPDTSGVLAVEARWDLKPTAEQTSTLEIDVANIVSRGVAFDIDVSAPDGWGLTGDYSVSDSLLGEDDTTYEVFVVPDEIDCEWQVEVRVDLSSDENSLGYPDFSIDLSGGLVPCVDITVTPYSGYPNTPTPLFNSPTPTGTLPATETPTTPPPTGTPMSYVRPIVIYPDEPPGLNQPAPTQVCPACVINAECPRSHGSVAPLTMRVRGTIIANSVAAAALRVEVYGRSYGATRPIGVRPQNSVRLGVGVTDANGQYDICVPAANYVQIKIRATDSVDCDSKQSAWTNYSARVQANSVFLNDPNSPTDPVYSYTDKWRKGAAQFIRCPSHVILGTLDLGAIPDAKAMYIASHITYDVRQAMLKPEITSLDIRGLAGYKALVGYPGECGPFTYACVLENQKIRVEQTVEDNADYQIHEYGHIVHGTKSGHHIYIPLLQPRRIAFLEGLADIFRWAVEFELGTIRTKFRFKTYHPPSFAETHRALSPEDPYEGMASFFWDVADYNGSHQDNMECPPSGNIADNSTFKFKGIYDSLPNTQANSPDWAAHFIAVNGLTGAALVSFRGVTRHHHILVGACNGVGNTPIPPSPAPPAPTVSPTCVVPEVTPIPNGPCEKCRKGPQTGQCLECLLECFGHAWDYEWCLASVAYCGLAPFPPTSTPPPPTPTP